MLRACESTSRCQSHVAGFFSSQLPDDCRRQVYRSGDYKRAASTGKKEACVVGISPPSYELFSKNAVWDDETPGHGRKLRCAQFMERPWGIVPKLLERSRKSVKMWKVATRVEKLGGFRDAASPAFTTCCRRHEADM